MYVYIYIHTYTQEHVSFFLCGGGNVRDVETCFLLWLVQSHPIYTVTTTHIVSRAPQGERSAGMTCGRAATREYCRQALANPIPTPTRFKQMALLWHQGTIAPRAPPNNN